jgi:hypothetical protein
LIARIGKARRISTLMRTSGSPVSENMRVTLCRHGRLAGSCVALFHGKNESSDGKKVFR